MLEKYFYYKADEIHPPFCVVILNTKSEVVSVCGGQWCRILLFPDGMSKILHHSPPQTLANSFVLCKLKTGIVPKKRIISTNLHNNYKIIEKCLEII